MAAKWFSIPVPNPQATLRLLCFPYAGGTATIYRAWPALLPSHIELVAVELPGHGARMAEPLHSDIAPLIADLARQMPTLLDRPLAFFGFSMGSLIAYELAQRLYQERGFELAHLFVAAHRAPQLPETALPTYTLSAEDFRQKLISLNGTPQEVLDNAELYGLVEPILRADFQICNTYPRRPRPLLPYPLSVFGSVQDPSVSHSELAAWQHTTSAPFTMYMLPGDHFFITTHRQKLVEIVSQTLASAQAR